MLTTILILVVIFISGLLIFASMKPNILRIERSIRIDAKSEKIFPILNDFRKWTLWSPYEGLDPELKRTYSGPESGKGSVYEYDGNSKAGAGRMEIIESSAPSRISISLEFLRPFKSKNTTEFILVPEGDSTKVIWAMLSKQNLVSKVMCIFINMDKLVGKDFEKGLTTLKEVSEK